MGFPKPDGPKDADLPLPFVHRGHHVGEDDQTSNQENDDRYSDGKLLEMVQGLHLCLEGLFDGSHLGMGQLLRNLSDDVVNRTSVAEGRDLDQAQSLRLLQSPPERRHRSLKIKKVILRSRFIQNPCDLDRPSVNR